MNHGMTLGQIFMSWSSHPELCLAKRWKEKNMFGGHAVYAIVPVQTILSRGNNSSGILLLNHKRSWKIWSFTRTPEKCPTSQPLKAPKKVSSLFLSVMAIHRDSLQRADTQSTPLPCDSGIVILRPNTSSCPGLLACLLRMSWKRGKKQYILALRLT